jgi:alpha-mannosidase
MYSIWISILATSIYSLEVFLIPHSHNDVGWLLTMDQYYDQRTHFILNNVFDLLTEDPLIKFSWAESAYLSRWLTEYPEKKEGLKQFISEGRLEIIGGGWTQNDEASPDFELVIRQQEIGYNFLKKELNVTKIRTGWQIDPFGHSSLTPALWEKMGFETMVFQRIPEPLYKVKTI